MEYVREHAHYKDAGVYTVKFKQLQSRALGLVKTYVTSSLRKAASAAMEAAPAPAAQAEKGAADGSGAEAPGAASEGKGEMAGLYVRFRAAAPALAPLTSELRGARRPRSRRRRTAAPPTWQAPRLAESTARCSPTATRHTARVAWSS